MSARRRKFWGWGYDDQTLDEAGARKVARFVAGRTCTEPGAYRAPPRIEDVRLRAPRVAPPSSLASIISDGAYDRAAHTYGKSYPDYVRAYARDFGNAPDLVAFPRDEADVVALLDWAGGADVAVIPYGAGSTVVGGVEPIVGSAFKGTLSLDLGRLDRVREIDTTSRAARIEAGVYGPALEAQLKASGLTLRHFPQSFEFSTLGGWIATRSGGHFATLYTHIDDLVESLRTVTPTGVMESRRLPGSGAGPSPDRLMMGSEGALGIITEAWVKLQERPRHRASRTYFFDDFMKAASGLRAVSQAGLYPANSRLVDAEECALAGVGAGEHHLVVLTFESGDHAVEPWMARAEECLRDHGGQPSGGGAHGAHDVAGARGARDATADIWREAFIKAPFNREGLIACGLMHDTFETSITWERLPDFHATIKSATERAIRAATGRPGHVTCRFTHLYPDGPAPYFTLHATPTPGAELEQWRAIKIAASDALIAAGGTITHHHSVGRDHMPWYVKQRPALFGAALEAAKRALDPKGILNPGVLVPARTA